MDDPLAIYLHDHLAGSSLAVELLEKLASEKWRLLKSEKKQWDTIADQIKELREKFGKKTPLGKRRTDFAEAPEHDEAAIEEAMVVREPITVVLSDKGWVRALRGHVEDLSNVAFKQDDKLKLAFFAETAQGALGHRRRPAHIENLLRWP